MGLNKKQSSDESIQEGLFLDISFVEQKGLHMPQLSPEGLARLLANPKTPKQHKKEQLKFDGFDAAVLVKCESIPLNQARILEV